MENAELEYLKAFKVVDILEYLPHSIVIKSIIRKNTGHVSAVSFDSGEVLVGKTSPYEIFIQIIEGNAEVIINDQSNLLEAGQSIMLGRVGSFKVSGKTSLKLYRPPRPRR